MSYILYAVQRDVPWYRAFFMKLVGYINDNDDVRGRGQRGNQGGRVLD
jgi:hypothetical protein